MSENTVRKLWPISLTAGIVILDQILKAIIVATIPLNTIGVSLFGGALRIIHVQNLGIAFSIGGTAPGAFRGIVFMFLPIVVLALLAIFYFRSNEITTLQRWAIAGILGGGIGNLVDRIFRPGGVVDFIDAKFYGIFGLQRWPTFNLADASVVICGILLVISVFLKGGKVSHE